MVLVRFQFHVSFWTIMFKAFFGWGFSFCPLYIFFSFNLFSIFIKKNQAYNLFFPTNYGSEAPQ